MSTPKPPKSDDPIADFLDFGFFIPAQIGGIFGAGYGLYTGCTKYTDRVLFDQYIYTCSEIASNAVCGAFYGMGWPVFGAIFISRQFSSVGVKQN